MEMWWLIYTVSEEEGCGHTRWELSGEPITSQEEVCTEVRRVKYMMRKGRNGYGN